MVSDIRTDIIASGTVTADSTGHVATPWVSTEGVYDVVILVKPSASSTVYAQDSNDQETTLRFTSVSTVDASGGNLYTAYVPGAAFLSLLCNGAEGTTFTYSIRAVG